MVSLGDQAELNITVSDDDSFTLVALGAPDSQLVLVSSANGVSQYVFQWTLTSAVSVDLVFEARDTFNSTSIHTVLILYCLCGNGGTCVREGVVIPPRGSVTLPCLCPPGKPHTPHTMLL